MTRPSPEAWPKQHTYWCESCDSWYWGGEHTLEECVAAVDEQARDIYAELLPFAPRVLRDRHRELEEATEPTPSARKGRRDAA